MLLVFWEWFGEIVGINFMPHGMCYMWQPATLWSNVLGDGITAVSYFLIPGLLVYFVKKRENIEFKGVFWAFAAFIVSCGAVHIISVVNVWIPLYNLSGLLKLVMAAVSMGTVLLLVKKMPNALQIPTPGELEEINKKLVEEIKKREILQRELEKQAKELQYTIETLKETQSIAHVGTWELDIEKKECVWSDEVYRIHEVPLGTPISLEKGINYYHDDYKPVIEEAVNKGIAEKKSWDEVCVLVTESNKEVWVRAIGQPVFKNDELIKLQGLFIDINERKMAKDKLEVSEKQLRTFVENAPVAVAMLDNKMNYITVSNKWYEEYKIEFQNIIGMNHYDIFPEIRANKKWLDDHKRVLAGEELKKDKDKFVREDKSIQWITWKLLPWYNTPQEIGGMIMYTADITNEIKYQEKLENLNEVLEHQVKLRTEELNSANKELESFSYSISHDLRAPLRSINGFAEILEEDYRDILDEEGKRLLGIIKSSGIQMGQLIDDILNFSRLGRKEIKKQKILMDDLVKVVYKEISLLNTELDIDLKQEKLLNIMGDVSLLKQVVVNLLSNAVKYSSKEEKIKIEISSVKKDEKIVFKITDNGTGFDMKYHDKLFGVFQRLHSSSEYKGTGVGLAIVKRIINKHGGEIWAESTIGIGSSFYFSLPIN